MKFALLITGHWPFGNRSSGVIENSNKNPTGFMRKHNARWPADVRAAYGEVVFQLYCSSAGIQHIFPWMAVQRLLKSLLVQGMAHQADAAGHHEKSIQVTNLNYLICLLL